MFKRARLEGVVGPEEVVAIPQQVPLHFMLWLHTLGVIHCNPQSLLNSRPHDNVKATS